MALAPMPSLRIAVAADLANPRPMSIRSFSSDRQPLTALNRCRGQSDVKHPCTQTAADEEHPPQLTAD